MSLCLAISMFSAPILLWSDSLYLDVPRLGVVQDFSFNGRSYQWLYSDFAVYELNAESRWCMGIKDIPGKEQTVIDDIIKNAVVNTVESLDLEIVTRYLIDGVFYESQYYSGPWNDMDKLFRSLMPSYTTEVRNEPVGAGVKFVHGTLGCGSQASFRSISESYNINAPEASSSTNHYFQGLAKRRFSELDELDVDGVLCLDEDTPRFFYILEDD